MSRKTTSKSSHERGKESLLVQDNRKNQKNQKRFFLFDQDAAFAAVASSDISGT
jgi:hypothetical protein